MGGVGWGVARVGIVTLFHHSGQCVALVMGDYNRGVPFATWVSWFDLLGKRLFNSGISIDSISLFLFSQY